MACYRLAGRAARAVDHAEAIELTRREEASPTVAQFGRPWINVSRHESDGPRSLTRTQRPKDLDMLAVKLPSIPYRAAEIKPRGNPEFMHQSLKVSDQIVIGCPTQCGLEAKIEAARIRTLAGRDLGICSIKHFANPTEVHVRSGRDEFDDLRLDRFTDIDQIVDGPRSAAGQDRGKSEQVLMRTAVGSDVAARVSPDLDPPHALKYPQRLTHRDATDTELISQLPLRSEPGPWLEPLDQLVELRDDGAKDVDPPDRGQFERDFLSRRSGLRRGGGTGSPCHQ
jgi:hypothetical protein